MQRVALHSAFVYVVLRYGMQPWHGVAIASRTGCSTRLMHWLLASTSALYCLVEQYVLMVVRVVQSAERKQPFHVACRAGPAVPMLQILQQASFRNRTASVMQQK
jgi:hypothetical protein